MNLSYTTNLPYLSTDVVLLVVRLTTLSVSVKEYKDGSCLGLIEVLSHLSGGTEENLKNP